MECVGLCRETLVQINKKERKKERNVPMTIKDIQEEIDLWEDDIFYVYVDEKKFLRRRKGSIMSQTFTSLSQALNCLEEWMDLPEEGWKLYWGGSALLQHKKHGVKKVSFVLFPKSSLDEITREALS